MSEYNQRLDNLLHEFQPSTIAGRIVAAITGLLIGCLAINTFITRPFWHPYTGQVTEVVDTLKVYASDIETLYLGSSHVQSGVNPLAIDEANREAGYESLSFNFWMSDANYASLSFMLDTIDSLELPRLRFVIFEPRLETLPNLDIVQQFDNAYSTRVRYIYTLPRAARTLDLVLRSNNTPLNKLRRSFMVVATAALSVSNLGVLSDLALPRERPPIDEAIRSHRGHLPPKSAADIKPYEIRQPKVVESSKPTNPAALDAVAEIAERIRGLGAQPVVFFPPTRPSGELAYAFRNGVQQRFPDIPIIDWLYTEPPHPIFEDASLWTDGTHMTLEGTALFSPLLSSEWQALQTSGTTND